MILANGLTYHVEQRESLALRAMLLGGRQLRQPVGYGLGCFAHDFPAVEVEVYVLLQPRQRRLELVQAGGGRRGNETHRMGQMILGGPKHPANGARRRWEVGDLVRRTF